MAGHHYALVDHRRPRPGHVHRVRGAPRRRASAGRRRLDACPPSVIRTLGDGPVRVLFGSCRTAAPHEPPWTLELALDPTGRGVDALRAHALRDVDQTPDEWPHLARDARRSGLRRRLVADHTRAHRGTTRTSTDRGPATRARRTTSRSTAGCTTSRGRPTVERWFFSVVPSAMIFDDHDMIDDWNISDSWVRRHPAAAVVERRTSSAGWCRTGSTSTSATSAPPRSEARACSPRCSSVDDGAELPARRGRARARSSRRCPVGYRFSFVRELGDVALVVIDCRNGRVLDPGHRSMVDADEWAWIVEQCRADARSPADRHVAAGVLAGRDRTTSSGGTRRCATGRGVASGSNRRTRPRRALDLEDWPAFGRSFDALGRLLAERRQPPTVPTRRRRSRVLSGDIHFSYHAELHFPADHPVAQPRAPDRQLADTQRPPTRTSERRCAWRCQRRRAASRTRPAPGTGGRRTDGAVGARPRTGVRQLPRRAEVRRRCGHRSARAGDERRDVTNRSSTSCSRSICAC